VERGGGANDFETRSRVTLRPAGQDFSLAKGRATRRATDEV
jgi:hypothetical protein